jgi:hypothetical protein
VIWRTGKRLGRTLYDGDRLVGMMDSPELAARVVEAVNATLLDGDGSRAFTVEQPLVEDPHGRPDRHD